MRPRPESGSEGSTRIATPRQRFAASVSPALSAAIRSDFSRNVAETMGTKVLLVVINAVTTVLIARLLGPDGRGEYAVAIALTAIAIQVGSLGLQSANTYFAARDPKLTAGLYSNSLVVALFGVLTTALALGAFASIPAARPIDLDLIALALAAVPPALLVMNLRQLLLGVHEVRAYNKIDLIAGIAGGGATLGVLVSGAATPATLLVVPIGVAVLGSLVAARGLRAHVSGLAQPSLALLRRCAKYGLRVWFATGLSLLLLRIDVLVIQFQLGSVESGIYSVAATAADMLWLLPSVVAAILFPSLSASEDVALRWRRTLRAAAATAAAMLPILAGLALFAEPVVRLLFGEEFRDAASSLRLLCAGVFFFGATSIVSQFLNAGGLPWSVVGAWLVGFISNLVLNIALIPALGIEGAALASLISYALVFVLIVAISLRVMRGLESVKPASGR